MVKTFILQVSLVLLICTCFGQSKKDLVFGKFSKEEIIQAIQFSDSCNQCDVIRIDNVNEGPAFLIILSEKKVIYLDDFRIPDSNQLDRRTMARVMSFICKNDSKITERPKGVGTYRIVYRHKNSINLYFR